MHLLLQLWGRLDPPENTFKLRRVPDLVHGSAEGRAVAAIFTGRSEPRSPK